ncbi:hypothetical protein ACJJTC_016235, partial [Scirpophaga incertulas]
MQKKDNKLKRKHIENENEQIMKQGKGQNNQLCCKATGNICITEVEEMEQTQEEESEICMVVNSSKYRLTVQCFQQERFLSDVSFLIDTGADIVAISGESVKGYANLEPSTLKIRGADNSVLNVIGIRVGQECQSFLTELSTQLQSRLPFENPIFRELKFLDPHTGVHNEFCSLRIVSGAIDTIEEQTNTADLRDPLRYQSSPAMKAV